MRAWYRGQRVLFIGAIVLFIEDDATDLLDGREERRARPDGNRRLTAPQPLPVREPLRILQGAMQKRDLAGEAGENPLDHLRREGDFRDADNCSLPRPHTRRDGAQVDFRLAAAGHAVQEKGFARRVAHRLRDAIPRDLLRARQYGRGNAPLLNHRRVDGNFAPIPMRRRSTRRFKIGAPRPVSARKVAIVTAPSGRLPGDGVPRRARRRR